MSSNILVAACALAACSGKEPPPPAPAPSHPATADPALVSATVVQISGGWSLHAEWITKRNPLTLQVRCAAGDRVFTTAALTVGGQPNGPVLDESEDPLPVRPERCEILTLASQLARTPDTVWCWTPTGIASGPCTGMPVATGHDGPIAIEDLQATVQPGETAVAWTVVGGSPPATSVLRSNVACAIGNRVYVDHPRSAQLANPPIAPGVRWHTRRVAWSSLPLPDLPGACEVSLWLDTDRIPIELARSCWTAAGTTAGRCTSWPPIAPGEAPVEIDRVAIAKATIPSVFKGQRQAIVRITADVKLGVLASRGDTLTAHVRFRDGNAWTSADDAVVLDWHIGIAPGETRMLAVDLPSTVTDVPRSAELTFTWQDRATKLELATYCLSAGRPRPGRCS